MTPHSVNMRDMNGDMCFWGMNRINLTRVESIQTNLIVLCQIDLTMLTCQRMGHIGEKILRALHNKGMVEYFQDCNLEVDFCEHFIYGKQNRVRFPSGVTRENGILELIHSDVFELVIVPSLGGSLYYVSFVDDFSKKTWIYFLRTKLEFLRNLMSLNILWKNREIRRSRC
jgi:hypothetical protein